MVFENTSILNFNMDKSKDFGNWLRRMGYEGEIPDKIEMVCNPNTAFIWDQLMQTVKPKQEVQHIRNNILIKRLRSTNSASKSAKEQLQLESRPPIKEIEVWKKKQSLKKEIRQTQKQLVEIESELDKQTESNNIMHLKIENKKKQINEINCCTFLLKGKQKQLQNEITEVQGMLAHASNLTPVEEDSTNKNQVLDTLKQCTLHLEKILENQQQSYNTPTRHHTSTGSFDLRDESGFHIVLPSSSFNDTAPNEVLYDLSILEDEKLKEMLQFLYKYNRHDIWNYICEVNEIHSDMLVDSMDSIIPINKKTVDRTSLTRLYGTHVEYEMKAFSLKVNNVKLQKEISEMQQWIFVKQVGTIVEFLKNKQKECGLIAAIQFLRKFTIQDSTNYLAKIKDDIRNLDKSITHTSDLIRKSVGTFRQIYEMMQQMRADICMLTKKLGNFTANGDWTQLLNNDVSNIEVTTFIDFPLEYNTVVKFGSEPRVFVKDLPVNYLSCESYDFDMLQFTTTFFSSCFSPPEVMLTHVLQAKERLHVFKSLVYTCTRNSNEGTLVNFDVKESYINYALDTLNSMKYSKQHELTQRNTHISKMLNLWMEMPFGNFVLESRLFNGLPYKHYENLYDNFYKELYL